MKKNSLYLIVIIVVIVISYYTTSCKKDHSPKATITVMTLNNDGEKYPLEGAIVRIFSDPTFNDTTHEGNIGYIDPHQDSLVLEDTQISNEYGQTNHEFHYESILHIEAKFGIKKNDTLVGFGALILKEDETYEETVIVK